MKCKWWNSTNSQEVWYFDAFQHEFDEFHHLHFINRNLYDCLSQFFKKYIIEKYILLYTYKKVFHIFSIHGYEKIDCVS